jgi:hypothetical protein
VVLTAVSVTADQMFAYWVCCRELELALLIVTLSTLIQKSVIELVVLVVVLQCSPELQ